MNQLQDILSKTNVANALIDRGLQSCQVEVFDRLPSTSAYLKEVQLSNEQPFVFHSVESSKHSIGPMHICATDWQTQGSGRRGKVWETDRGNLTFSVLVHVPRKPAELLGLSLVTGICVAESLLQIADAAVKLKWPNDILFKDRKLSGLLTEILPGTDQLTPVLLGIGINYTAPSKVIAADYESICLPQVSKRVPARATLIAEICAKVDAAFAEFVEFGWPAFAERWKKLDYLTGRTVRVITDSKNTDKNELAVAVGVDHNGALLVEKNGKHEAIYSGDVSVRPV